MKIRNQNNKLLFSITIAITMLFHEIVCQQPSNPMPMPIPQPYTIPTAYTCFTDHALPQCSPFIQSCFQSPQCHQQQLSLYNQCVFQSSFQSSSQSSSSEQEIFNGYCFNQWLKNAKYTKELIECLDEKCGLARYNNQIGVKQLYKCIQQALLGQGKQGEILLECDDMCQDILKNQIAQKIKTIKIKSI